MTDRDAALTSCRSTYPRSPDELGEDLGTI
jgi:hypothetical protein